MTPTIGEVLTTLTDTPELLAIALIGILAVYHVGPRRLLGLGSSATKRAGSRVWAYRSVRAFTVMFLVGFLAQYQLDVAGRIGEVVPI